MKCFLRNFCCKEFFAGTILVILFSSLSWADVDDRSDKALESRLHNIYEKHYSREVLDSDWFKVIHGVQEQTYTVKKGDTLWGISTVYFGDGNYWSKLWSMNQSITNPHLIFNGDQISFTTGSFKQPPSISVNQASQTTAAASGDEAVHGAVSADSEDGEDAESTSGPTRASHHALEGPNNLPDFFKPPYDKFKKSQNITSIVARPPVVPVTNITLTEEVLTEPPPTPCTIKSVGIDRVITGEGNIVILRCSDLAPPVGTTMSVVDSPIETIQHGSVIKVLAVVKIRRSLNDNLYEANVIQQWDAMLVDSLVANYVPQLVNIDNSGPIRQLPVSILNANDKSIWSTGDVVFIKMNGTPANSGDILSFSNKYDYHINSFQRNALVKVVSTRAPFATGVVIESSSPLREDSVSEPTTSDSWIF